MTENPKINWPHNSKYTCVEGFKINCPTVVKMNKQLSDCNALLDQLLLMVPGDDIDIIGKLQTALGRETKGGT